MCLINHEHTEDRASVVSSYWYLQNKGNAGVDQGFPVGGVPALQRGRQHMILPNFAKTA